MNHVRQEQDRQRWGYRFLKPHEIKWITSRSTLRAQTALSIKERSSHFLREFPTAHMNPTLLRDVYRLNGIKKKKVRWYKEVPPHDAAERRRAFNRMKRKLEKARKDGYRIIYLDETMFTRKTVPNSEWALPG